MLRSRIGLPLKMELPSQATSYRDRILQYFLENKAGVNIDELSKYLKISRTAVQKYFLMLEKESLIKKYERIKTLGRPSISYVLTQQGINHFPKRYALLSEMLLKELKIEMDSEQLSGFMQKLGKKLAAQYRSRFQGKSENERIATLHELMQELGFYAVVSRDPDTSSVEMTAHNCIYHDVAQQFNEICSLDQTLIAELLNKKVEMRSCMAKGDGACCFRMSLE